MLVGRLPPSRWLSSTFVGKCFYVQMTGRDPHVVMREKHLIRCHGGYIMRQPFPGWGAPADFFIIERPPAVPKKRRHYLHYVDENMTLEETTEGGLDHLMLTAAMARPRNRPLFFRSSWLRKCIRKRKCDTSAQTIDAFGASLVSVPKSLFGSVGGPTFHYRGQDRPFKIFLDDTCARFSRMVEERGGEITAFEDAEILVFPEPAWEELSLQQQRLIARRPAGTEVVRKEWVIDCLDKGWCPTAWYPIFGLDGEDDEDEDAVMVKKEEKEDDEDEQE
ncbi:uncharacterized protein LOC62_07G008896 [Vanrija pseudolonga]|uniref:BRCT domain-containing protein n=1 Tax=Vanrija pseudolonga TaxID=143232 RepID=A0AAF0YGY5_9TREE|nr:hypothetical protein LOC62_07G008896 [Vanrija pseudolonga]